MKNTLLRIVIGGDVGPINRAASMFAQGNAPAIFTDLLDVLRHAHVTVINLECCLLKGDEKPILKDGPNVGTSFNCINGIKNAGITGVNLANNHILDYGLEGLQSTIEACEKTGIFHFGAGSNLKDASKLFLYHVDDIRIGFLGIAEHEFSIAGEETPGANPTDLIDNVRAINMQKEDYDFLIVLVHGGKEYYQYPTPNLMKMCRFLVEQGAGAVICQHSHCPGSYEIYKRAPIVYGQGNLAFDRYGENKPQSWYEGVLVQLSLDERLSCSMDVIPFYQFNKKPLVELMKGQAKDQFLKRFGERSSCLIDEAFVLDEWQSYCMQQKYTYFSRLYGYNRVLRVLNRRFHFSDWLCSKTKKTMVRNVVECETHREVLETLWRMKK